MGDGLGTAAWDAASDSLESAASALGSSSVDPAEFKSLLVCSIVACGLYAFLTVAGLVQFIRLVRVRYLPRFVVQKAYALLLFIAALCLLSIILIITLLLSLFFPTFFLSNTHCPSISLPSPPHHKQCDRCSLFCCR